MGRHSFREADVVRDDWGRFGEESHSASSAASSTPSSGKPSEATIRARQGGGNYRVLMPDAVNSAEIKGKDGTVKFDHHGDGSLTITTPHGSATLPARIRERMLPSVIRDTEKLAAGETMWVRDSKDFTTYAAITRVGSGTYTLHLGSDADEKPGLTLTESQLDKINDTSTLLTEYNHRIDTGNGNADIYLTSNDNLGLRTPGNDGTPVDIELSPAQARKLNHAIGVVYQGFDHEDPDGPESGVSETSFSIGGGKRIHVTQQGTPPIDSPDGANGDLLIEADDGSWAFVVTPKSYEEFTDTLHDVVDAL
ncbi:hypothetical protein [Streptosporangium sp. G12]